MAAGQQTRMLLHLVMGSAYPPDQPADLLSTCPPWPSPKTSSSPFSRRFDDDPTLEKLFILLCFVSSSPKLNNTPDTPQDGR